MRNDESVAEDKRPNPDALLEAAQRKVKEGVEVVIGVVETHGRAETLAMLDGMAIVPRAKCSRRCRKISV